MLSIRKRNIKIFIILVLSILIIFSLVKRGEDIVRNEDIYNYDYVLNQNSNAKLQLNIMGLTINYDSSLWYIQGNNLIGKCDEGYYIVSFYSDSLSGESLDEIGDIFLSSVENKVGIEIMSKANSVRPGITRLETLYRRLEINSNNIVTGNSEVTKDIYIKRDNENKYYKISIKYYQQDDLDYEKFNNDVIDIEYSLFN